MIKKGQFIIKMFLASAISLSFAACGGRVPTKPAESPASPSVNPSTPPSTPVPTPSEPGNNNPPANNPPDDGSGDLPHPQPSTPHPSPPDPQQPNNPESFFTLMKRFGFIKTKEELTADIKKGVALKISDWSPGAYNNKQKNMEEKFNLSVKYFKPAIKDIKEYQTRSMKLSAQKDGIDFYVDVTYGPKDQSINLIKVDAKTLEIVFYNKSGLITNYTQTSGSLLRLAHFMLIPPSVYSASASTSSVTYSSRW